MSRINVASKFLKQTRVRLLVRPINGNICLKFYKKILDENNISVQTIQVSGINVAYQFLKQNAVRLPVGSINGDF